MQIKQILLTGLVIALNVLNAAAQNGNGTVTGKIKDDRNEALPGALIKIAGMSITAISNAKGDFKLSLPVGLYRLEVSAVGMLPYYKEFTLETDQSLTFTLKLKASTQQLKEVAIATKGKVQAVREQAFNVAAIDVKALHNTSLDLNQVLGKAAGARVREDGGLGSNFNFSLNGFSGKQVRFFMDGIPMDNFGSALSLNNIPVNLAERIEVYKGVVPIWLGADALGGAVNVVSNSLSRNYLDVSYSYGSFNTHRSAISGAFTNNKTGWLTSINLFQNYSDNNYWVNTPVADLQSGSMSAPKKVQRFHDQYRSESLKLETGITNRPFADKLLLGVVLGQNYKEAQTAAQMSKVFGGKHFRGNVIMPTLRYQKDNMFIKGLNFNAYASYNLGYTQAIDTLNRVYTWTGEFKDNSINSSTGKYVAGSEESRTLYKYKNNSSIAKGTLSYDFSSAHSVGLNYVLNSFNRKGEDILRPNEALFNQPMQLKKHTLGLGYKFDHKNTSFTAFVKNYIASGKSTERVDIYTNPHWMDVMEETRGWGYGTAASYFINPKLQVKASYEKAFRMPDGDELFGDPTNALNANKRLKPETSHNFNAGTSFNTPAGKQSSLFIEGNLIYRKASDFIAAGMVGDYTQMVNMRNVRVLGGDILIRYNLKGVFNLGSSVTYQDLRNTSKHEPGSTAISPLYKAPLPNIPIFFGNADIGLNLSKIGLSKTNPLNLTYYLNFVDTYYLKWPSLGYSWDKNEIPSQLSHDITLGYSLKNGRYNISAECRNITDSELYDNFMMQKPGRSFAVKLRYFIRK
jgi:outer membrane receptor protein involved in Fe transport